jgi:hypothetical protein
MKITAKFIKNVEKIMKVTGFIISANGDPSVGINPTSWKLEEDFYFDDQEELEAFRAELKIFFENYCGEVAHVQTYEEYQKQIDAEDIEYFQQYPVRYLIRDRGYGADIFKQANFCASYSSDVGTGIHAELPKWIPEKGDTETEVIKSTDPMYKEILRREAERLENQIRNEEYRLGIARTNLRIIAKELNIGLKTK